MNNERERMRIAYIAYQYPTLTQTFIQREIESVAALGIEIEIHAMRGREIPKEYQIPKGVTVHPYFLSDLWLLIFQIPIEFILNPVFFIKGLFFLRKMHWRGFENLKINLLGIAFAIAKARRFRNSEIDHFHGVWATGMTTAAMILAKLTGKGKRFSMGAHAFDIYRHGGDGLLKEKLKRAAFVHTTTLANVKYLKELVPEARLVLSRRGLKSLPDLNLKSHSDAESPFMMLTVARLVPKKGLEHQIQVCRKLKESGLNFRHRIIGEGPLREELKSMILESGLEREIELLGALSQEEVQSYYRQSDLFWHSGLVDQQGDRDGLPNVIPEAFSWGLSVVSSPTPGADEAVENEVTGIIVDPRDHELCAEKIHSLAFDRNRRERMGFAGRRWVEENFMSARNAEILVDAFRLKI